MRVDSSFLRGAMTPLVTPYRDGAVDVEAFSKSIEHQIEGGSHGVVVTGTTGEPSNLSVAERILLFEIAVKSAKGRLKVIAATGSSNFSETLAMTEAAESCGADAIIVVAPPFVKPSQMALQSYFSKVAKTSTLPLILYNIPGRAAVNIDAQTVVRIAEACPTLVGVKSALADLDYVTALIGALGSDFKIFCGVESLSYPMLALGGAGLMSAVGNLIPKKVAELCAAVDAGDHEQARAIHYSLFDLNRAIFFDTNPVPLKAMLALTGLGNGEHRLPLIEAEAALVARLKPIVAKHLALASAQEG
jgi:4-hydroxy-tetrahydrodipicolinate synthase